MIAARILRHSWPALAIVMATLWAGACDDTRPPSEPDPTPSEPDPTSPENEAPSLSSLIVSNPVGSASGPGTGLFVSESSSNQDNVFISLPPGSVPNGERVLIRARGTGAEATTAMVAGGFDPIPIAAMAGDTLDLRIEITGGEQEEFVAEVPARRPPIVVRTDPPPQRRDVPLNAVMLVVFSEPIDAASLTPSSVQLLLDGAPVDGALAFGAGVILSARFTPAELLAPGAEYRLLVTQEVEDLDGDALETSVTVEFTTGSEVSPVEPPNLGSISGVVSGVTATGVSPLAGAQVFFYQYHQHSSGYLGSVVTDSEGRYSFPQGGSVNVYAHHPGFRKPCVNFGDGTQDIVLYSEQAFLNDDVQPPADASPMVSGVVYEDVDGELTPLAGVDVTLDLLGGMGVVGARALSNSSGEYFLCRIPEIPFHPLDVAVQATTPWADFGEPGWEVYEFYEIAAEDQELDIIFRR